MKKYLLLGNWGGEYANWNELFQGYFDTPDEAIAHCIKNEYDDGCWAMEIINLETAKVEKTFHCEM